ncbi:methyl-accepting chemotaxis protein [Janthinobacterium sp. B9-8]|uniref:methyl-accepting chemotaxis protein n=1 Tax=Janthinobacterium sp. B9-8 TaxID=1236179 RepID=UPI00061CFE98|nr:methyl-accepting chemotaxis protein [Janthinobacterium sp. B9-8]AMC34517.1 hypothetical protein VN23_07840 [Janthinobacterium sp. B9-8]
MWPHIEATTQWTHEEQIMNVTQRLLTLVGTALLGVIAVTGVGLYQISQVYHSANYATINSVPSLVILDTAFDHFVKLDKLVSEHVLSIDMAAKTAIAQKMPPLMANVEAEFKKYEPLLSNDHDKQMLANNRAALTEYDTMRQKIIAASTANQADEARNLLSSSITVFEKVRASIEAHRGYNVVLANQGDKDAQSAFSLAKQLFIVCGTLAAILSIILGIVTARGIVLPLQRTIGIANRIASGDLTNDIRSQGKDETAQMMRALGNMQTALREAISAMRTHADSLATSAVEMVDRSKQVSLSAVHQSDAASNMAATVEEMTVSIGQITHNARDAQKASLQAESLSKEGAEVIHNVANEIRSIASEITETATKVTALGDESQRISSIVAVIREVAEQTNLLALNAAIEAARAGEQGRGFAVVADEVRKLAERTSAATKEIADMIKLIQDRADHSVAGMNRTVDKVSSGVDLANLAAEAIGSIADSAKRAEAAITAISSALQEQTTASGQIAGSVERIAQMTEESSVTAKMSSASATALSALAQQMRGAVLHFNLE